MTRDNRHPSEDPAEGSRKTVESELDRQDEAGRRGGTSGHDAANKNSRKEVEGQFAPSQASADSDGVDSADPKVISGNESGDATFPLKQDERGS
jgi:hypothetical protein